MNATERIRAAAERVVASHGLELFDVQLRRESIGWVVRVFIDRPGSSGAPEDSIGIEDCARVSRELSAILDVEDPLDRSYTLEVSSPGLDRPLRGEHDFRRFTGRRAKVTVAPAVDGQSFFAGRIEGVEDGTLLFEAEGRKHHRIPLDAIKRAQLDVEF
ncbi:MAG TPA: ribosome maturation factor RimP [Vicinamibacterales bacterium]|nr:ribosome maturation factor RimP [Vicinamibacterales bacterium]